jgi:cytochrome c
MRIDFILCMACALATVIQFPLPPSHARPPGRVEPGEHLILVVDAQRGARLFQSRCGNCHTVQEGGPNKIGPNLHGVFGRSAGSLAGYNYSPAMLAAGVVWNDQTLEAYLTDPAKDIPGDKMPFPGLPDKADREDVIAYMHQATQ